MYGSLQVGNTYSARFSYLQSVEYIIHMAKCIFKMHSTTKVMSPRGSMVGRPPAFVP